MNSDFGIILFLRLLKIVETRRTTSLQFIKKSIQQLNSKQLNNYFTAIVSISTITPIGSFCTA